MKNMNEDQAMKDDFDRCIVHEGRTEDDCEFCVIELDQLKGCYEVMVGGNMKLEQELARYGAELHPMAAVATMQGMMADVLMPDPKMRYAFEMELTRRMKMHFGEAIIQAREQKLGAKGRGLVVPQ